MPTATVEGHFISNKPVLQQEQDIKSSKVAVRKGYLVLTNSPVEYLEKLL